MINKLNDEQGPLFDMFERYFFDQGKLKTTTVVSYGLRPLCGLRGAGSLYVGWDDSGKEKLQQGKNADELERYIDFCSSRINTFLKAVKSRIPPESWTPNKKVPEHLLTTTIVNGLLLCLRELSYHKKLSSYDFYTKRLAGIEIFPFTEFKSSQYNSMGLDLYENYFSEKKSIK